MSDADLEAPEELKQLQLWMVDVLRNRRALFKDPEVTELSRKHFTGNDRLSPVEQAEIYREQFWLRHTSSLVEDFPGVGGIVGQEDWERLVEEYLEATPPLSYSLRDLGDVLPAFIEKLDWLPHRELCTDMARLEWAYVEAFDANDHPPLDPQKLASMPESAWETAKLVLHPSVQMLRVRYPVVALRQRIRKSEDSDEHEHIPIPEPSPSNLVIYRAQNRNLMDEALADGAYAMLEALADGLSLVDACGRAMLEYPDQASDIEQNVGAWFQLFAQKGFIVDVVVS
jgi:hypothetical protein